MPVLSEADRSAADSIALSLMRRAFLALAEAHIAFDPERGRQHVQELQQDAVATIRAFFEQDPDEADARIFFDVALNLRATLREALGLPEEIEASGQANGQANDQESCQPSCQPSCQVTAQAA